MTFKQQGSLGRALSSLTKTQGFNGYDIESEARDQAFSAHQDGSGHLRRMRRADEPVEYVDAEVADVAVAAASSMTAVHYNGLLFVQELRRGLESEKLKVTTTPDRHVIMAQHPLATFEFRVDVENRTRYVVVYRDASGTECRFPLDVRGVTDEASMQGLFQSVVGCVARYFFYAKPWLQRCVDAAREEIEASVVRFVQMEDEMGTDYAGDLGLRTAVLPTTPSAG